MECLVRDVVVHYEIHGEGTPILMIHGWGPDRRLMTGCMEPVFAAMPGKWQRIYFDLPGMGETTGAPWIDGSDRMLDLVLGVVDTLIPGRRFLLAGESYGGYLARGILRQRPSLVDGLLLICPVVDPATGSGTSPELRVLDRDEALLASLSEDDRAQFEGVNVVQTAPVWRRFRDEILCGLRAADQAFLGDVLGRHVPFTGDVDALDEPFAAPTLMLTGRQDSMVGYRDLWTILESYPRASFVVLDRAGHNLQIEQDVLFDGLVREWLDRVEAYRRLTPPSSAAPGR
ncbi:MAG: alpha/beta hydrolase [Actinomycetales bacterium]|nr:alpha/beta hydrolase [Actinomycetales bacterium]